MEKILDVIKYARESSLSKESQLDVIQDAYSKWLRGEKFIPSKLVEAAGGHYCVCTLDELSDWTTATPDYTCVRCRKPRS